MGLLKKHRSARELEAEFDRLYIENESEIFRLAWRLTGDADAAEDITQKTLLTLHTKLVTVLDHPNPKGWIMQTVHFYVMHHKREQARRAQHEVPIELAEQVAAPQQGNDLESFADSLPEWVCDIDREILTLYYYYGYTLREIAGRVGLTYGGVRNRLSRLLQKLSGSEFSNID